MNLVELTPKQLRKAAAIKERIAELQTELNRLLGAAATPVAAPTGKPQKRRKMSAAGRARIAAAARARWAKIKAAKK
jgi:hypothetical protein